MADVQEQIEQEAPPIDADDAIAAGFADVDEVGTPDDDTRTDEEPATQQNLPEGEELQEQTEPDTSQDVQPEPEANAAIPSLIGLSEEEAEQFNQLAPELQTFLTSQEANRQQLLSKQSQQNAEARKALEQHQTAFNERVQQLEAVFALDSMNTPELPDPALAQTDPNGYADGVKAYQAAIQQQEQMQGVLEHLRQEQESSQAETQERWQQEQGKRLLELIPLAADPEKWEPERSKIVDYAKTNYGVSDEELPHIRAESWAMAQKAMKYDEMMQKANLIREQAPVVPKPSKSGSRTRTNKSADALEAFSSNPNEDTLAAMWSEQET